MNEVVRDGPRAALHWPEEVVFKGRAADNDYTDGWSMDAAAALKKKVNR